MPSDIDIFAEVERAVGADLLDPHPTYHQLRAEHPVFRGDLHMDVFGRPYSPAAGWEGGTFAVLGFAEAQRVLRDTEHFSNRVIERSMGAVMGRNILLMDDPEHRLHRMFVERPFRRAEMDRWQAELVAPYVTGWLDQHSRAGATEFMRQLAMPLPATIIHAIIGLPDEELDEFHEMAAGMFLFGTDPTVALSCAQRIADMIQAHIDDRRRSPRNDLMSALANGRLESGDALTDEEIVYFLRLLLPAGAETTTRLLGSLMVCLLADDELRTVAASDPAQRPALVEETLRLHPPFNFAYRLCLTDAEVGGVRIPAGSTVQVAIAAANRDPRRFADPDRFVVGRTDGNLAFGLGPHLCLGMHLARMEATVVLQQFFDWLEKLRLDERFPVPQLTGLEMTCVGPTHIRWN